MTKFERSILEFCLYWIIGITLCFLCKNAFDSEISTWFYYSLFVISIPVANAISKITYKNLNR